MQQAGNRICYMKIREPLCTITLKNNVLPRKRTMHELRQCLRIIRQKRRAVNASNARNHSINSALRTIGLTHSLTQTL